MAIWCNLDRQEAEFLYLCSQCCTSYGGKKGVQSSWCIWLVLDIRVEIFRCLPCPQGSSFLEMVSESVAPSLQFLLGQRSKPLVSSDAVHKYLQWLSLTEVAQQA